MFSCASTGQEKKAFNGKQRAIMSTGKCHQWPLQKDQIIQTVYFFCTYIHCVAQWSHSHLIPTHGTFPDSMIQCTLHLHKEQAPCSGSPSAHCTCTKTFFLCNEQRTPVCPCNTVGARVTVTPPCIHTVEGNPLADAAMSGEQKKMLQALEADEVVSQERLVIFEQGSLDYVKHCADIAMDVMLDKTMNKFRFSIIDND
ncbi:hypothetical protein EDC04DRAFT_2601483 [Pisolithus marmoratus]|nr:hypothetical protein EDC04DRAFT_2601483 [Pisolithus marmoratus]